MCDYPFFIPQVVLFANSSLFWFKVTNEHREFRNYLLELFYTCVANLCKIMDERGTKIPDEQYHYIKKDDYNKCIYHKRDMDATERNVVVMKDADILIKICDSTGDFDDTSEYQLLIRLLKERTIIDDGGSRRLRQKRGS